MAVLGAPADYEGELRPLPAKAEFSTSLSGNFDWIQIFVRTKKELDALAPRSSGPSTRTNSCGSPSPKGPPESRGPARDNGWDILEKADLRWVALISVNQTWSAFSLRAQRPGEPKSPRLSTPQ
jgi:hypothetical protein